MGNELPSNGDTPSQVYPLGREEFPMLDVPLTDFSDFSDFADFSDFTDFTDLFCIFAQWIAYILICR